MIITVFKIVIPFLPLIVHQSGTPDACADQRCLLNPSIKNNSKSGIRKRARGRAISVQSRIGPKTGIYHER